LDNRFPAPSGQCGQGARKDRTTCR
jgi:hypothetical protein